MGGGIGYLIWYIISNDKPVVLVSGLISLLMVIISGNISAIPTNSTTIVNEESGAVEDEN